MLPTASRLSLREQPHFFSESRKAYSSHLIVYWQKKTPVGATVIVAKKQITLANRRNTVKRKIREALKLTQTSWQEHQVVVMAKRSAQQLTVVEITRELQQIFSRMKV